MRAIRSGRIFYYKEAILFALYVIVFEKPLPFLTPLTITSNKSRLIELGA